MKMIYIYYQRKGKMKKVALRCTDKDGINAVKAFLDACGIAFVEKSA